MQTIAKLINHHQDNQRSYIRLYLYVVIKPSTYLVAEQKYRQTHAEREQQVQSESVVGIEANGGIVFLTHKVAHTDGHGCSHTRKHEVEELRNGNHYLVSCQWNSAEPAYHHATQRKGSRFHT